MVLKMMLGFIVVQQLPLVLFHIKYISFSTFLLSVSSFLCNKKVTFLTLTSFPFTSDKSQISKSVSPAFKHYFRFITDTYLLKPIRVRSGLFDIPLCAILYANAHKCRTQL